MTGSPAKPTTALSTTSAPRAASTMPSSPTSTSVPAGTPSRTVAVQGGIADDDDGGEELGRLCDEHIGGAVRGERVHPESLGLGADDVERLRADRA